jgi:membrane-associated phospholipid phosphatase
MKRGLAFFTLATFVCATAHAEPTTEGAHWRGGVLVDSSVRSALRAETKAQRSQANDESNALLYSMVALPTVNAAMNAPNVSDAASLMLVNAETFGVTFALVALIKAVTKRERPYASAAGLSAYCVEHPTTSECKNDRNASFFSGHSATAFAGAGLVCMQQMEFGSRFASVGCGAAMTIAGATALLRIIADKHYATDTLVGALVGVGTGMLLPYVMHFARWAPLPVARDLQQDARVSAPVAQTGTQIAPWGAPGGGGMAMSFVF